MNLSKYRKQLNKLEDPIIIYHKDSDGVTSAAMMHDYVNAKTALPNDGPGIKITDELIDIINDYEAVLFLDIPVDQLNVIKDIECKDIFILDHHPPDEDLSNGKDIVHMNPRFEDSEAYLPASYLVYRVVEDELGQEIWKAGVGVVGDHGVKNCKDLYKKIVELYPTMINGQEINQDVINDSNLGTISDMIEASKVMNGLQGIKESFDIIYESELMNDVFDTKLIKYYEKYKDILEREKKLFDSGALYFQNTDSYLYEVDTNYSINSSLSTMLADENPESAIYIYQVNNGMKISARCQSGRVNVAENLKKAFNDYGNAGGHPQAAGGYAKSGKVETVVNRLKEILEGL